MSEDPTDLLALTPEHFLVGGPLLSIVGPEVKGESKAILNRWQHVESFHVMVVIKEDSLPSNEWRLGRKGSVFPARHCQTSSDQGGSYSKRAVQNYLVTSRVSLAPARSANLPNRAVDEGLPVAQKTVFGWILPGACTQA